MLITNKVYNNLEKGDILKDTREDYKGIEVKIDYKNKNFCDVLIMKTGGYKFVKKGDMFNFDSGDIKQYFVPKNLKNNIKKL